MSSSAKRNIKRKESKITLKHHKKHKDSSTHALGLSGSTGPLGVRPEEIKMHN